MRRAMALWGWFAKRPAMYRLATRLGAGTLKLLGRGRGAFHALPFAGGWTAGRDLPVPEGRTFMAEYARRQRAK